MDYKKIYRILSLLFLVLTVLFSVLYIRENNIKANLSEDYISKAVANLRGQGIEISEYAIDPKVPDKDIYSFKLIGVDACIDVLTEVIGESVMGEEVSSSRFETPEGIAVNIYSKKDRKEIGRIVFDNSDLSFSYLTNGSISGIENPVLNEKTDLITDDVSELISSVCKRITNSSKISYRISGCSGDDEFSVVTAIQTIDGHDIFDSYLNFMFEKNKLVSFAGTWIIEEPKAKYTNTLVDGVNVLYSLDLNQVAKIEKQRVVYSVKNADADSYYLVPVWEITYMDKNGEKKTVLEDAI